MLSAAVNSTRVISFSISRALLLGMCVRLRVLFRDDSLLIMKVFEKLESLDAFEKLVQNSSAIADLMVVFSFVCGFSMQCVCFWGFRPQKRQMLFHIVFGGVSGDICEVKCCILSLLASFKCRLNMALAFLNCMMLSVDVSF